MSLRKHLFKIDNLIHKPTDFQQQRRMSVGLLFPECSLIADIAVSGIMAKTEHCRSLWTNYSLFPFYGRWVRVDAKW